MARLADFLPTSDDELSHSHQCTRSRQASRQKGSDSEVECTNSVPRISTPTRRDLVPRNTQTASSRKMRRLRGHDQAADNPLFQPWSAHDHDGMQALSQTTMRESPAKLGLVTEFENDSPPALARPARINALSLISPTRKAKVCSEVLRKGPLVPLSTEERERKNSGSRSARIRENLDSPNQTMSWTLLSSSDQELCHHGSHQQISAENSAHSSSINSTLAVGGSNFCCDDDPRTGSFSSLSPGSASVSFPPGIGKFTYNSLDDERSSVSTDYNDTRQTGSEGPLKPIRGNVPSPNRVSSIKLDNESALPEKVSAIQSTTPSDHEDLLSLFEQMRIDSHELSTDDGSKPIRNLPVFITPPSSPPETLSPSHKHQAIPRKPRGSAPNASLAETLVDDWNWEPTRQKNIKPECTVNQSKGVLRKGKKMEFEATKQTIAENFLRELDLQIANGQISKLTNSTNGVKIVWTKSLHTTAGRANWRRETVRTKQSDGSIVDTMHKHHASIELADKVIDDENRLLNVLAHEFCHLTTFMINGLTTNPHGKEFKSWASKCSRIFGHRGIHVTTKHAYEINFKYKWECTNCGLGYKRHSKSIDTQRHRCGTCKGELKQVKPAPRAKVANNSGASGQSEYQLFVKDQMKLVKRENPDVPQREILKIIAEKWAIEKKKKQKNTNSHTTEDMVIRKQPDDTQAHFTTKLMVDLTLGD